MTDKYVDLSQYCIVRLVGAKKYSNSYIIEETTSKKLYQAEISKYPIPINEDYVNFFCEKEMKKMLLFNHPSILKIIGFNSNNFGSNNKPTIITEYFSPYNLTELTNKKNKGELQHKWNDTDKFICLYGIASGMDYLHRNGIIHGDLTPENILIDDNCHPKIIYSKILKKLNTTINYRNEDDDISSCILSDLVVESSTKDDDIFDFSLIMYLILNGHAIQSKKQNKPIQFDENLPRAFYDLFHMCYSVFSERKPTFAEIADSLRNDEKFITEKVDLKKFYEYADSIKNSELIDLFKIQNNDEINSQNDDDNDNNNNNDNDNDVSENEINYQKDDENNDNDTSDEYSNKSDDNDTNGDEISSKNDDDDVKRRSDEKKLPICEICQKKIYNKNDIYYYHNYLYHIDCLKCRICNKKLISKIDKNEEEEEFCSDDLVCVFPGFFLCKNDYNKYKKQRNPLPREIEEEYINKMIKSGINELFNSYVDDINAFPLNKYIKLFIPSVTFHFEKSPSEINFGELIRNIPKDMIIINIEKGSTFLTIGFIGSGVATKTVKKCKEIIQPLIMFLNSAIGKSIVGNLIEEDIQIPTLENEISFFKRKSVNLLQLDDILEKISFAPIENEVNRKLKSRLKNLNLEHILNNQSLYNETEKAVRLDIEANEIDLVITGITIIANKQYDDFKHNASIIKNKVELVLYHGTQLEYQTSIANEGFLTPDEIRNKENITVTDLGEFGIGIYATNNIFYALMYSSPSREQYLNLGEKNSVLCCKTIFNSKYLAYLNNLKGSRFYTVGKPFKGKEFHPKIQNKNGVHQILVESSTKFHPIGINVSSFTRQKKAPYYNKPSYVTAFEYVFPNKEQIIPVFSLKIKRPKYFILWLCLKDDVNNEYSDHLKNLVRFRSLNFYFKQKKDEALQLVDKKKRNKLKFIITGDNKDSCRDCINEIRECHKNNFVCLIFSKNKSLIELTTEMENVLFTDDFECFDRFISLKFDNDDIIGFYEDLEIKYDIKFNIEKSLLLEFHPDIWK